jgi:hypothetical protein
LIEENAHSGKLGQVQAFGGMVEDRTHLLDDNAREQVHELTNLDSIFQVLKKG